MVSFMVSSLTFATFNDCDWLLYLLLLSKISSLLLLTNSFRVQFTCSDKAVAFEVTNCTQK